MDLTTCTQIVFQDLLLKPKLKKSKIIEEDELLSTMIDQLNNTENPKIVNKNGMEVLELVENCELKPKEFIIIEQTFPTEIEYNNEQKFLKECNFFYFFYNNKKVEIEFDQKEVELFYKGFEPGTLLKFEKNKKYPTWKKMYGGSSKELPSEEDFYKSEE